MDDSTVMNILAIVQQGQTNINDIVNALSQIPQQNRYEMQLMVGDQMMITDEKWSNCMAQYLQYVEQDAAWVAGGKTAKQASLDWSQMKEKVTQHQSTMQITHTAKQTVLSKLGREFSELVESLSGNAAKKLRTLVLKYKKPEALARLRAVIYERLQNRGPNFRAATDPLILTKDYETAAGNQVLPTVTVRDLNQMGLMVNEIGLLSVSRDQAWTIDPDNSNTAQPGQEGGIVSHQDPMASEGDKSKDTGEEPSSS